jgi:hypothetical protein
VWLSVAFLAVALGVLVLVAAWILMAAANPGAARCHNAPLTTAGYPQLLAVLVAVTGFALGRVTARPKVRQRRQVRSWVRDHLDPRARARAALITQGALTAALLFAASLMAFEAATLATHVWPITYYLRCANEAAPVRTLLAAAAFCFLAGRWLWLPTTPEEAA